MIFYYKRCISRDAHVYDIQRSPSSRDFQVAFSSIYNSLCGNRKCLKGPLSQSMQGGTELCAFEYFVLIMLQLCLIFPEALEWYLILPSQNTLFFAELFVSFQSLFLREGS